MRILLMMCATGRSSNSLVKRVNELEAQNQEQLELIRDLEAELNHIKRVRLAHSLVPNQHVSLQELTQTNEERTSVERFVFSA
jgi:hypothetical protein